IIVEPVYNITYPHSDGMGLIIRYDASQKKYWYGFVNEKGKVTIAPQFASAGFFIKERSIVKNTEGRFGVIDTKGKFIIDPLYNKITFLEKSSLFKVINDKNKTALFDWKGKKLFDFKFDDIDDASSGLHAILNTDNAGKKYCTWIDRSGNEIPVKLAAAEEFVDGIAPAQDMALAKWGYMNTKGEWVIRPQYWMAKPFNDGIALIANSQTNTRWMYLNTKGDTLFSKPGYSTAESFKDGLALIDWKFVSKDGAPFLPQYNFCYEFRGGLAQVRTISKGRTSEWYLIDKTGNILDKTLYNGGNFAYGSAGLILKQYGWKYGVIDRTGKTIIEPKYDRLSFRNGMICTSYQDKNYNEVITCYITEKGIECWDN
ncbi:MAG TPA: WG repeat-containing protein, partial [Chitinophagaceae bacterium]|nr:WG repeat-containing protein [Chitinophagaceae bacterium]